MNISSEDEEFKNIVEAKIADDITVHYYTIICSYDENGSAWFATGILAGSAEAALSQFQFYSGVKHFHIVRIDMKAKVG